MVDWSYRENPGRMTFDGMLQNELGKGHDEDVS